MAAISSTGASSDAQAQLVKHQQKLATDVAAKAAAKVISEDKANVAQAQQAVQQAQRSSSTSSLDVTV